MNGENKSPKIIAHRGVPMDIPGNSFESIHAATALPIFGVEFDVDLTSDGVPIVFHQSTFPANDDFNAIELGSRVLERRWTHDYTFSEIEHFDTGSWQSPNFSHLRFTTLDKVLSIDWGSIQACVELKNPYFYTSQDSRPFGERIVEVVTPTLEKFLKKGGSLQLIFFDPLTLGMARARFPEVDCNLAIECFDPVEPSETVKQALDCGASGLILLDKWLIQNSEWIELSRAEGLKVWAYELTPDKDNLESGTNTLDALRNGWQVIYDLDIDGLHTDYPVDCYKFFKELHKRTAANLVA